MLINRLRFKPAVRAREVFSFSTDISRIRIRKEPIAMIGTKTNEMALKKAYSPKASSPRYRVANGTVITPAANSVILAAKLIKVFLDTREAGLTPQSIFSLLFFSIQQFFLLLVHSIRDVKL